MRSTYLLSLLSSAAIYIALSVAAFAAPPSPTPLAKFTAAGLRPNEYVGYSVATDGQRVLIGTGAGSAFLYDPFSQLQLAKVILPDPRFGTSVALQGNIAVVGTRGGAYLYDFSNMASVSRITLTPDDYPASVVGGSVDLSGDVVIAGAASDSTFGETSGAAYLFNSVTGVQIAKLVANDAQPNDGFGIAVAIDNGLAAVANSQPTSPTGGAVYLFDAEASAVGNRQLAKYTAANGQQSPGQFGYNVDINEETLVATQPFGRSFFWPADGTPTPLPNSSFNTRAAADGISVSDDYIALGFEEQGLVRLYNKAGNLLSELTPPPGSPIGFGVSVAIEGDLLVVGAGGGSPDASAAFIYRVQDVIVPEPNTMMLALLSGVGIVAACWRRRH